MSICWINHFPDEAPLILINDTGLYFEKILAYEKKFIEKIFKLDLEKDIIKYPAYEEALKIIPEIIKTKKMVILGPTQHKEIGFFSTYFPIVKFPVVMDFIIKEFVHDQMATYDEEKILAAAEKSDRYKWLTLFVFGRIHQELKLNPSYLYTNGSIETVWQYYDLNGLSLKETKKYLLLAKEFDNKIFLELAASELLGKETPAVKLIR
ncbi:MAG: hypothetical protein AABW48_03510 [Nanoarchaeota archaeon]